MEAKPNNEVGIRKRADLDKIHAVWREDNILHYYIKEDTFITMEDVEDILDVVLSWGQNNQYLHLFEIGINATIDTDVREWAASDKQNSHTIADAIIVRNMAQRIVGNFYMKFNRPVKPTKLFTSVKPAINWLLQQGSD